jgi:similar to stage IV sporulation protein
MRLGELWPYLTGYVRIRVTGPSVERFLNLVAAGGRRVWRTRRGRRSLEANVDLPTFRNLRRAARRTRTRVRILERRGLPFVVGRLRRRPLMVLGAALFLSALYALSAVIWVVDVEGVHSLDPALIREVAASYGLRPGVLKTTVDIPEVERGLILAISGLSWAAVELHGATALIRVVEKDPVEMPDFPVAPADIVAAKDGVITDLIVLAGQAVVKEGDTVRAGDLLIAGLQPAGTPPPPARPGSEPAPVPTREVVAKGIVKARVWYQAYAEARLHTLTYEPTGRVHRHVALKVGDLVIPLYGWWKRPVGLHERQVVTTSLPWWREGASPVEVVSTTYTEVVAVRRDLTPAEAQLVARDAAMQALSEQLPEGIEPVSFSFKVVVNNDIVIGVLVTAETLEDIGRLKQRQ